MAFQQVNWRHSKKELSKPLSDIINLCFLAVTFSETVKIAKITRVFRKDKLDCKNYRQILLLFLEKNTEFLKFKFGSRNNHSCFNQQHNTLIIFTEQIHNTLDNNKFAGGVFIDLYKAFDTVNHKILSFKFKYYDVYGLPLSWF